MVNFNPGITQTSKLPPPPFSKKLCLMCWNSSPFKENEYDDENLVIFRGYITIHKPFISLYMTIIYE
uniref:Uncharacterized protein n=1 Tax=Romanomermis culicivorax TaxID=13658 RepID=A0A915HTL4_ROMCU